MRGGSRQPLRVLFVTPRYLPETGGVEEHVRQVSRRLATAGAHVTIATTDTSGRLPPREVMDGVEVVRVRAWPRGRDLRLAPALWPVVARGAWDVVHVQSYHTLVAPLAMLAAARARIPYVLTFHAGGHSSRLRHRARPLQRWLLRPLLVRSVRLVALTSAEADGYAHELRLDRARFAVVPNGVEIPVRRAPARGPRAAGGRVVINSVGRLERYKGHHRIMRALPAIVERCPTATLRITGSGTYEHELHRLAASLGVQDRVTIHAVPGGDADAMVSELEGSDLVVLLSDFETQPLVVLEAAAIGRPTLVADSPGLRELAAAGLARSVPVDAAPAAVADAVLEQLTHPVGPPPPDLPTWDETASALLALYRDVVRAG